MADSKTSPDRYAPKIFATTDEGKAYTALDHAGAMERKLIYVAEWGKASRPQKFLRSGPHTRQPDAT